MSFEFLNQLPTPADIKRDYPLSPELRELKKHRDLMISDVITGKDSRVLVIIGPCSADNEDSVCDYVSRLTKIQEDVKDQVILVPRIYTNKPRTTGEGYKGIASQPDPEKAPGSACFQEADFSSEVRPVFCAWIKINGSSTIPPISERAAVKVKGCT